MHVCCNRPLVHGSCEVIGFMNTQCYGITTTNVHVAVHVQSLKLATRQCSAISLGHILCRKPHTMQPPTINSQYQTNQFCKALFVQFCNAMPSSNTGSQPGNGVLTYSAANQQVLRTTCWPPAGGLLTVRRSTQATKTPPVPLMSHHVL